MQGFGGIRLCLPGSMEAKVPEGFAEAPLQPLPCSPPSPAVTLRKPREGTVQLPGHTPHGQTAGQTFQSGTGATKSFLT